MPQLGGVVSPKSGWLPFAAAITPAAPVTADAVFRPLMVCAPKY